MPTNTNADLIADNRRWVQLHRANQYQAEAAKRMTEVLDALEAADQEKAEAWRVAGEQTRLERDRAEAAEQRAEDAERRLKDMRHLASIYGKGWDEERDALAAVVEKVRRMDTKTFEIIDILASAPADVLREHDAALIEGLADEVGYSCVYYEEAVALLRREARQRREEQDQ